MALRKRRRFALWLLLAAVLLLAGGLIVAYEATQHVPEFYRQAIAADPLRQEQQSDEMLQQATALLSRMKKPDRWEAIFSAEQINGWLGVDMVRNHGDTLPSSLSLPRVAIEPDRLLLACRFQWGPFSTVLNFTVDAYLAEPNLLALRIRRARAGLLPMPLGRLLDQISAAARQADLHLTWRRSGGDPVALILLADAREEKGKAVHIERLQLGKGEVYLAGTTVGSRQ